jgi:nicotinamidase-related amidase
MAQGLLLVDIQNDYFPGGRMELVGMTEASRKAGDLLKLFRNREWPTFHVQHVEHNEEASFFRVNTDGVEIHESVKPLTDDIVIQKSYPNSFCETRLKEDLVKAGVKRVVICGAMSHMCIDATTRAAYDSGFECIVIHDACATKNLQFGSKIIPAEQVHGSFMAALGSVYADVMSYDKFCGRIQM